MESIIIEGKTVEEAIEKAASELKVPQEKLNIEIISEASPGMLSLMGGKKAKIKATLSEEKEERHQPGKLIKAKEALEGILTRIKTEAKVEAKEEEDRIYLNILGDGSGLLIGKRGQTLDALQYIVSKIVRRSFSFGKPVVVDTENYQTRRKESLTNLALQLGEKAKKSRTSVMTAPLSAQDRRIIHLALYKDSELTTSSEGEGLYRRVVISPWERKSREY